MRRASVLIAALLAAGLARAEGGGGSTSGTSFKLPRSARAAALGGAYAALADEAQAMLFNPAALNELREVQLAASHLEWLDGVRDDSFSLGVPLYGFGAWGLGSNYLYSTDTERDNWGNALGSFSTFDFSAQAAFGLQLGSEGGIGAVYKIIRQGYQQRFNMGSSFDLGLQYRLFNRRLSLALVSQNMGSSMALGLTAAPPPLTFRGGAAWKAFSNLSLAAEYEMQPYDHFNKLHLGTELDLPLMGGSEGRLSLRGGYTLGPDNAAGGMAGFSAGVGAKLGRYQVDYAFIPKGDLGLAHLLTLSLGFGSR